MFAALLAAGGNLAATGMAAEVFSPQQLEFFEKRVRPVLAESCYKCHGPEKQTNGLRLDSRTAILKGSKHSPVVTPGNAEASKLVHAVRHDQPGSIEPMPKEAAKLPQESIDAITTWINAGLPWPDEAPPPDHHALADPKSHWSFQPVQPPPLPEVKAKELVYQPVDAYILKKLEESGLSLSPKTDRVTRIRRLYLDLLGIPPTWEDVEAFAKDPKPDAYIRLVDRVLASPHFGERWARHWLDLSRYADTKGYVFQEERRYPYAYTYRDWVIRALNADMPYDKFVSMQIAADQLVKSEDPEQSRDLAALGFLTLGRRFLNVEADIIDDRLDVVFRSTQGLTIGCARCHDHKNDPISMEDYYGLYGVFASSMEPKDLPQAGPVERTPEVEKFEAELAKRQEKLAEYRKQRHAELFKQDKLEKYLQAALEAGGKPENELRQMAKDRGLYLNVVQRWIAKLNKPGDPISGLWNSLAKLPPDKFADQARSMLNAPEATQKFAPALVKEMKSAPPANASEMAKVFARVFAEAVPVGGTCRPELEPVKSAMMAADGIMGIKPEELEQFFTRPEREKMREIAKDIEHFKATNPAAPPRAMALVDKPQPVEPVIFIRGNPGRPGAKVPRQFLHVLSSPDQKPFTKGSGRQELAQRLTDINNPLTARVLVNRVWGYLQGQSMVDTPSDFGLRTTRPVQGDALDYLAANFMRQGWSIKKLIREIVLSATYQQQSLSRPEAAAKDPENRLCWRMNRKRLDFEAMRDSLLKVSGNLDAALFGKPVETLEGRRRTLYSFIDRQNLPGTLRTFDFASPDQHAARRFETTVPQQALYFLNNLFVMEQARTLADSTSAGSAPQDRVRSLIRHVYARDASPEEIQAGVEFILSPSGHPQTGRQWSYGFGGFDPAAKKVSFTPLPWFGQDRWSGSNNLPDSALGWVFLRPDGGHPGHDSTQAAIRRWSSESSARVRITGTVELPAAQSSGIIARIVSDRQGLLREVTVPPRSKLPVEAEIDLQPGEILDFILDSGGDENSDGFRWVPRIAEIKSGHVLAQADRDFSGPRPDPWHELTHALICSNEFVFVD